MGTVWYLSRYAYCLVVRSGSVVGSDVYTSGTVVPRTVRHVRLSGRTPLRLRERFVHGPTFSALILVAVGARVSVYLNRHIINDVCSRPFDIYIRV